MSDLLFVGLVELMSPNRSRNETSPRRVGGVHVARGSSVTNCKFVRLMVHAWWPTFTIDLGQDGEGVFAGNTILWENSLGAMQATYAVVGADEFTAVGSDIESYGACFNEALVQVTSTKTVRLWGVHGRAECHRNNVSRMPDTGLFDIGATALLNLFPMVNRVLQQGDANTTAQTIYRPELRAAVEVGQWSHDHPPPLDMSPPSSRFRLVSNTLSLPTVNNVTVTTSDNSTGQPALTPTQIKALAQLVRPSSRAGGAWGRPTGWAESERWRLAARHAFDSRTRGTLGIQDDTEYIQSIINSSTDPNASQPSVLPAGVYHISKPLRIGSGKFLVGDGPDRTMIFALDPAMAMVQGDGTGRSYRLHLAGVTLSGGAYGVHMQEATFGPFAQVTKSWISHVLFANFSKAGIFLDDIFGLDNNLLSHLTFDGCAVGFLQHAPASQRVPGLQRCKHPRYNKNLGYMDKTVFYRNRHTASGPGQSGVVMEPCRADNLNMWFETEFEGLDIAMHVQFNGAAMVASSVINNCGASITGQGIALFNSEVIVGPYTAWALPSTEGTFIEGSRVTKAPNANSSATLFQPGKASDKPGTPHYDGRAGSGTVTVMRSHLADMSIGVPNGPIGPRTDPHPSPAAQWVLLDTRFEAVAQEGWNKAALVLVGYNETQNSAGPPRVVVLDDTPASTSPTSQLLFGPDW